jgi:molybdopterin molybdotransferase
MITVEQALALVENEARPLRAQDVPLIEGRGRILAESVRSDADEPPFDRSQVDGYAIHSADLDQSSTLRIGETILAGRTPSRALAPAEAAVITTGAPLPERADAVVMHEETEVVDQRVRFTRLGIQPGQNVLPRGRIYGAGDTILSDGARLSAAALGLLASVGRVRARVIPRPQLAIVPTGDELVEPEQSPGPGQIRNSNAVMLQALALDRQAAPILLPTAPDEPSRLSLILEQGLRHDVLVISGGVSAGQRDLVPGALQNLGVRPVFHKVRLKPGKPLWFGVGPARGDQSGTLVFGLPGNPISSLVGFLLFVSPAIGALSGRGWQPSGLTTGRLATEFTHRGDRPTYYPARRATPASVDGPALIETLRWAGSADLSAVARAEGFVLFPAGDRVFHPGETLSFMPLSWSSE